MNRNRKIVPAPNPAPAFPLVGATVFALALASALVLPEARAADIVKANNNNALNLASSWTNSVVPGSADRALFGPGIIANRTTSLGASMEWDGIVLLNNTNTWIITGAFTLTNGASGIDMSQAGANFTIRTGIDLGAAQTWNVTNLISLTIQGPISGGAANTLTKDGEGTLTITNFFNTFAGGVTVNAGMLELTGGTAGMTNAGLGSGTLTLNNGATFNTGNRGITNPVVIGAGNAFLSGNMQLRGPISGSGSITHTGDGGFTLNLFGANTNFSGSITNLGSTIGMNHKDALGTGVLVIQDNNGFNAQLSAGTSLLGANAVTNDVVLLGTLKTGSTGNASDFELKGVLSGTGGVIISHNLADVTLSGANTYEGDTILASGARLTINNALALQNSTLNFTTGQVVFGTDAGITAFTLGGLSGDQNVGLTNAGGAACALTVGGNSDSTVFSGALTHGGSLIKTGAGTLDLGGADTYLGTTTVSNGTLSVNGTHFGGGQYEIHNTAALGGTGVIDAAIHVLAGGYIAPGNSIGTLSISNNVDLDGILTIELLNDAGPQGLSDMLDVNGLFDISAGTLQLSYAGTLTNDYYIFAEYDSLAGPFASFALPDGYTLIYQFGANNNQIALVIPEPSTFALLTVGGALALGLATRERRRRIS